MQLIDTHSHIYYDKYKDDLNEVVNRATSNNICNIICVGVDIDSSRKSIRILKKRVSFLSCRAERNIYFSISSILLWKFSITFSTCTSMGRDLGGTNPLIFNSFCSSLVKPVPLLNKGLCKNSNPDFFNLYLL